MFLMKKKTFVIDKPIIICLQNWKTNRYKHIKKKNITKSESKMPQSIDATVRNNKKKQEIPMRFSCIRENEPNRKKNYNNIGHFGDRMTLCMFTIKFCIKNIHKKKQNAFNFIQNACHCETG